MESEWALTCFCGDLMRSKVSPWGAPVWGLYGLVTAQGKPHLLWESGQAASGWALLGRDTTLSLSPGPRTRETSAWHLGRENLWS